MKSAIDIYWSYLFFLSIIIFLFIISQEHLKQAVRLSISQYLFQQSILLQAVCGWFEKSYEMFPIYLLNDQSSVMVARSRLFLTDAQS